MQQLKQNFLPSNQPNPARKKILFYSYFYHPILNFQNALFPQLGYHHERKPAVIKDALGICQGAGVTALGFTFSNCQISINRRFLNSFKERILKPILKSVAGIQRLYFNFLYAVPVYTARLFFSILIL